MDSPDDTVASLRGAIDRIDQDLVRLLDARAACVFQIGEQKRLRSRTIYDPQREAEVFARVLGVPLANLTGSELLHLYRRLVSAFRTLELGRSHKHQALASSALVWESAVQINVLIMGLNARSASAALALRETFPHWQFLLRDSVENCQIWAPWVRENNFQISAADEPSKFPMPAAQLAILSPPETNREQWLKDLQISLRPGTLDAHQPLFVEFCGQVPRVNTKAGDLALHRMHVPSRAGHLNFENTSGTLFYDQDIHLICHEPADTAVVQTLNLIAYGLGGRPSMFKS